MSHQINTASVPDHYNELPIDDDEAEDYLGIELGGVIQHTDSSDDLHRVHGDVV